MCGDLAPRRPLVSTRPDLATRCAEVHADRIVSIDAHRLTFDGEPRALGEPVVLTLPRLAGITRHVHGGPAVGARPRPHVGAVHREHPHRVRITRVELDRKTDVADLAWHGVADSPPSRLGTIDPIDAAVVLLVQPVG